MPTPSHRCASQPLCCLLYTSVAPLGDPMELNVRGYELSVRKADAAMIEVE